jgi:sugar phosphate isomerase/epimerase
MRFFLGIKTDPIEHRFSYAWLFRLMAEEGARFAQLGTFCELYSLPDTYFHDLRETAALHGIRIESVFTTHRELGGFMRREVGWEASARRSYERLIEVAALVGASTAGANAGSVLRDDLSFKDEAIRRYLVHMKELMQYAAQKGVGWLTVEPMSCLAEPPTTPTEIVSMMDELTSYHQAHTETTAKIGLCVDIAHGYADRQRTVVYPPMDLIAAAVPYMREIHLKNTDETFDATFGFAAEERGRGIVDVPLVKTYLQSRAQEIPVHDLVGYLEIGGPKSGRDYSDEKLEKALRQSLRYLVQVWPTDEPDA